ncbi:MAG: sulfotransferase [Bacteroidota bacterium]
MEYLSPHFFIIGERKCGTSSLYRYLLAHPQVLPCAVKEPQYFTKPWWKRQLEWKKYQALFPVKGQQSPLVMHWPELDKSGNLYHEEVHFDRAAGIDYVTGEASANTFYEAHPRAVKQRLPDIRLIVLLREPVARTYSHYRMISRFKAEGRPTQALTNFDWDMRQAMEQVMKGKQSPILSPSLYIQQLEKWWRVFPKEQLLVIPTEALEGVEQGMAIMNRVTTFLGLTPFDFASELEKRYNQAPPKRLPEPISSELRHFFAPYNQILEDRLGQHFNWNRYGTN